jgi:hypothetical protein
MTGHVTSRYQDLNSSEVEAKIENLRGWLGITLCEIVKMETSLLFLINLISIFYIQLFSRCIMFC